MRLLIKICGMTDGENIRQAEQLGVDMIGFIFYPKSPRCVCELPSYLPERAKRVGVFVNESKEHVRVMADRFGLYYLQLHGNESPAYCRSLRSDGLRLMKAFSIASAKDLAVTAAYEGLCDYYLFDTKTERYGGSGHPFDWSLLGRYAGRTPFLLSGGINPFSARAIGSLRHPLLAGIDLNSRFETAPGLKDIGRIGQFLESLAAANLIHPLNTDFL